MTGVQTCALPIYRSAELFLQASRQIDTALADPKVATASVTAMAQICATIGDYPKLETVLQKLVALQPGQPEPRYDLAALQAITGKSDLALQNLRGAITMSSQRLATNAAARNLISEARSDPRFNPIRALPEFLSLIPAS